MNKVKYILLFLALAGAHYFLTIFVTLVTMWKPVFLVTVLNFPAVLLYQSLSLEWSAELGRLVDE